MNPDKTNESKNEPNIVKTYAEITTRNQKREDIKLDTMNNTNPTNTCVYWCPSRFPFQMMLVSFNSNTTGINSGAENANPSGHLSSGGCKHGVKLRCSRMVSSSYSTCEHKFRPYPYMCISELVSDCC
jgi:hypothetical protein